MCFMTAITVWVHIASQSNVPPPPLQILQPVGGNPFSQINMFCLAHVDFVGLECVIQACEPEC